MLLIYIVKATFYLPSFVNGFKFVYYDDPHIQVKNQLILVKPLSLGHVGLVLTSFVVNGLKCICSIGKLIQFWDPVILLKPLAWGMLAQVLFAQ